MRSVVIPLLMAGVLTVGCERKSHTESKLISERVSFEDPTQQEHFKEALTKAGAPYTLESEEGKEFVRYDVSNKPEVDRIDDSLFLPAGRHISFDAERQAQFKKWLDENNIPYRTMQELGQEYIVWEAGDAKRVREWKEFPSGYDNTIVVPNP